MAIVGAPNVGKSTLANQLFGQERSITADLPGTTRDWVGEMANINGLPVLLVDTPGLRHTDDAIEAKAIERSRSPIAAAGLIVLVLDATRAMEPEQSPLITAYPQALIVANKCDQRWAWDVAALSSVRTAATTGMGLDELRQTIARHFRLRKHPTRPTPMLDHPPTGVADKVAKRFDAPRLITHAFTRVTPTRRLPLRG